MKIIQNNFNIYQNKYNSCKQRKNPPSPPAGLISNDYFNFNNRCNFNPAFNIIPFTGKKTTSANFEIKNILNLRCPICNQIMLNEEQELEFSRDIISKTGESLIKALEFYEDERNITQDWEYGKKQSIFRKSRQEIVDIIKKLALEHPKLNLKQLIMLHAKPILQDLSDSQLKVINELKNYTYTNIENEQELEAFNNTLDEYIEMINGEGEYVFSRAIFLKEISKVTRNKDVQRQINLIAQKMPAPKSYIDIFFIKAMQTRRQNSKKIAKNLFHMSGITIEHLQPKSKNGKDRASNYICDCADCNTKRGSKPFHNWMEEIPNFDIQLQNYINQVQQAIENGEISPNLNYFKNIKETIKTLSHGKIDLKIPQDE